MKIYDNMVHRSLERYVTIFGQNGFVLSGLSEPQVSKEQVDRHKSKWRRIFNAQAA